MNLLTEYITLKNQKATHGFQLPDPTYLFIEHYGRRLEDELPQIAEAFGVTDYFTFSADELTSDSNLYMNFFSKLQTHAPTGRNFRGCILITLSERMPMNDFCAILTLLKGTDGIIPIFTQASNANIHHLLPLLHNTFFLRTVEGEPYEPEEQLQIIRSELQHCGLQMTEETEERLTETLAQCAWQQTDDVSHKLKSIVRNLVYDKLMSNAGSPLLPEDISKACATEACAKKPFSIGFAGN